MASLLYHHGCSALHFSLLGIIMGQNSFPTLSSNHRWELSNLRQMPRMSSYFQVQCTSGSSSVSSLEHQCSRMQATRIEWNTVNLRQMPRMSSYFIVQCTSGSSSVSSLKVRAPTHWMQQIWNRILSISDKCLVCHHIFKCNALQARRLYHHWKWDRRHCWHMNLTCHLYH